MRIEEVTQEYIEKLNDKGLFYLWTRFVDVWRTNFGKQIKKKEKTDRRSILENYQVLKKVLESRKLSYGVRDIDKALFEKSIYNLDVASLKEEVIVENFVSLAGDYIRNPKSVKKVDIVIRGKEDQNEGLGEFASDIVSSVMEKDSNVIYMAEGPTDSHIPVFDIVLRPREITKIVEISKPETTEKYHRIPVNETCKITATIDISEKKGIKALYCGKEKEIATYLFDVEKWTMAKAKKWIKEQKVKKEEEKKEEPAEENFKPVRIFKMDVPKQIIGVVVYAPDEEDTQGDTANEEEIEKAAHKFNIGDRVFKVMHEGKEVDVDLLESYLMPANVTIGKEKIKKGSWFAVCKINDKGVWKKIESGELTGISMGGVADRVFSLS